MEDYNILGEAESLLNQRNFDKPDFISVADADWKAASSEARSLLVQLKRFEWHLGNAYSEAIKLRDWEHASLLYELLALSPPLLSIDPELYSEGECRRREVQFIAGARGWIAEVKQLWPLIQGGWTAYYEKGQD